MDATFIRPDVQRAIEFPIQLLTKGLEWWALSPVLNINDTIFDDRLSSMPRHANVGFPSPALLHQPSLDQGCRPVEACVASSGFLPMLMA